MALEADALSLTVALAAYRDMRTMLHDERKLRKGLLDWGVTEAEREAFELLPDDERQCQLCKTTCFLSCVTCACTSHVACLRHYAQLCTCPPAAHKLRLVQKLIHHFKNLNSGRRQQQHQLQELSSLSEIPRPHRRQAESGSHSNYSLLSVVLET
ncbi:Lysine-specific demethylase lid [Papilio machaon]|uniref:Lysine-specific demethylase lid n=1 Tax=Papilio machaon TaxID=76193 RepID=A0A0N1IG15_PAPMA|nr:Lysine-specific demethylase lid [Papilio machaon]